LPHHLQERTKTAASAGHLAPYRQSPCDHGVRRDARIRPPRRQAGWTVVVFGDWPHHAGRAEGKILCFGRGKLPVNDSGNVVIFVQKDVVAFVVVVLEVKGPPFRSG
jgi:hypothetical protein